MTALLSQLHLWRSRRAAPQAQPGAAGEDHDAYAADRMFVRVVALVLAVEGAVAAWFLVR